MTETDRETERQREVHGVTETETHVAHWATRATTHARFLVIPYPMADAETDIVRFTLELVDYSPAVCPKKCQSCNENFECLKCSVRCVSVCTGKDSSKAWEWDGEWG